MNRARQLPIATVFAIAAACSPSAAAAAETDTDIATASRAIGRCFAHEDPACARPHIQRLRKRVKGSQAVAYAHGYERFLSGELRDAETILLGVAKAKVVPESLRKRATEHAQLASAARKLTAPMLRKPLLGGRFVLVVSPGPDEVLLDLLPAVLQRAQVALTAAFGALPSGPLHIHVYPKVEDLAAVSGLTVQQIRDSGTIALCKYNRVMLTSPNDLVFGYGWADTVVHEMAHWAIIRKAGAEVPIWLHEGLARSFEGSWRGEDPLALAATEIAALHTARRKKRFIPFAKMSPTMAALPSQEATQLAFAEVHHAVGWLLARARRPGTSGPISAAPLLQRFAAGDDEDAALAALLGMPKKRAMALWKKDLERGQGAEGPLPKVTATASKLRFKRVSGPDPFKGMGSQARRWVELGDRLLAIQRPLAAVIEYRKALGSGAKRSVLLMRRMARALVALGKFDEARDVAAETLRETPEDPALLQLHAAALHGLGKHKEALDQAQRSAWINPYDPALHELTARIHDKLGDAKQAAAARARQALVSVGR